MVSNRFQLGIYAMLILLLVGVTAVCRGGSHEYDNWPFALDRAAADGHDALLEGVLTLEGGCLILIDSGFGQRWLPILPYPGTEWDEVTDTLTVDGEEFRPGDAVGFGGGEGRARNLLRAPPDDCNFMLWDADSVIHLDR